MQAYAAEPRTAFPSHSPWPRHSHFFIPSGAFLRGPVACRLGGGVRVEKFRVPVTGTTGPSGLCLLDQAQQPTGTKKETRNWGGIGNRRTETRNPDRAQKTKPFFGEKWGDWTEVQAMLLCQYMFAWLTKRAQNEPVMRATFRRTVPSRTVRVCMSASFVNSVPTDPQQLCCHCRE